MGKLSFLWQYASKPRTVGAVLPSSKYLAGKMIKDINFNDEHCIVEYGAGTGVFTEKIINMRRPSTTVIVFEMNTTFATELTKRFGHEPNVHIYNESAVNINKRLAACGQKNASCIVSGLPFASLPQDVTVNILEQTRACLHPSGQFITFQYSLLKKDLIQKYFANIKVTRELRNMPPAYVLSCKPL